jgi:4-hydroxythreonine-4-phosphate dehydrogenase
MGKGRMGSPGRSGIRVKKLSVALTAGEPGGVGPEVLVKAVRETRELFRPVLVGRRSVLEAAMRLVAPGFDLVAWEEGSDPPEGGGVEARFLPEPEAGEDEWIPGKPTAGGGRAAVEAITEAVRLASAGRVVAIVTAPIAKEALRLAGYPWPGHTEMLADLTGTREYGMMLAGGGLRVMLVTIHCALRDVPGRITPEAVARAVGLAHRACHMLGIGEPRVAVAGLNPHAGEGGMFGGEEEDAIAPGLALARARGCPSTGPYPPDTVYFRAHRGEFDIVVSMYHDQGLIPLKLLAFDTGVNVTVGLPFVRTSPDHGTAFDKAWRNEADPRSMIEAIRLAIAMSGQAGKTA